MERESCWPSAEAPCPGEPLAHPELTCAVAWRHGQVLPILLLPQQLAQPLGYYILVTEGERNTGIRKAPKTLVLAPSCLVPRPWEMPLLLHSDCVGRSSTHRTWSPGLAYPALLAGRSPPLPKAAPSTCTCNGHGR